ncbi:hypothetical protein T01_5081 [Trichinella spiralis]|uniref:Uncharacterized protein n=1 Tax=Trichinella spiralis TaxID=6334 RepID=A0A0V1AU21_TRISP|nr:hypothetical protein T01_5081 [Trichinella spiralis]
MGSEFEDSRPTVTRFQPKQRLAISAHEIFLTSNLVPVIGENIDGFAVKFWPAGVEEMGSKCEVLLDIAFLEFALGMH